MADLHAILESESPEEPNVIPKTLKVVSHTDDRLCLSLEDQCGHSMSCAVQCGRIVSIAAPQCGRIVSRAVYAAFLCGT
jgi:hypothetical protein